jgi:catechol 2,3-dioxygenase-like lactoylglutathione lyase family enzyme
MRILVPVLLLALAGCAAGPSGLASIGASHAREAAAVAPDPALTRVVQIARDLDASVAFYRDVLGLPVLERRDLSSPDLARALGADPGARITAVSIGANGGSVTLMLLKIDDPKLGRMTHPRGGKGALGETILGLRVPDLATVETKLRATKANVVVGRTSDGAPQLAVTDPDGTRLLLTVSRRTGDRAA